MLLPADLMPGYHVRQRALFPEKANEKKRSFLVLDEGGFEELPGPGHLALLEALEGLFEGAENPLLLVTCPGYMYHFS